MKSDALDQMKAMLTAGGRNTGEVERKLPQSPRTMQYERERRIRAVKAKGKRK